MSEPIGLVRPGSSLSVIEQQLQAAYAEVAKTLPPRYGAFIPFVNAGLFPAYRNVSAPLHLYWLLMGAVALLLVLACANAANLLLTRARRRERDTALRLAIGAGQSRIIRQLLVESLGLATLAGAMGILAATLLITTVRGMRLLKYLPDLTGVEIDGRVLGFCLLVTATTVLAFGLLPAVVTSRTDIRSVIGGGDRTLASRHRLSRGLVAAQIALSLTLLTGAGVLNRSLQNLFATDLGMKLDDVIELALKPDDLGYDRTRTARVIDGTMDRLRRAGFRDVSVSYPNPLFTNGTMISLKTAAMAEAQRHVILLSTVSPDYFQVLRIPLLSGRTFTVAEYPRARIRVSDAGRAQRHDGARSLW